jgi:hypothetical protein
MERRALDRLLSAAGAVMAVILLIGGILALVGQSFANSQVQSQLVQEKVFFPPKGSAGLDPKEFPGLQQYAGQQVDTGDKAKAYADEFIWKHMMTASGGKTYAQVSTAAKASPDDQKLAALKTTLFQGDMLRGSLLTAYAFSRFAVIALWAGIVMLAGAVLLGLLSVLGFRHAAKVSDNEWVGHPHAEAPVRA